MKNIFTKYYFCGLFKYIQKGNELDLEKELNQLGRDIGQRIALLTHFKREKELGFLVYRLVFTLLPCLYQADRTIEKSSDPTVLFYIYENDPAFDDFDYQDQSFCASTIVAGVIEMILEISGFKQQVLAYSCSNEKKMVVYTICIKENK